MAVMTKLNSDQMLLRARTKFEVGKTVLHFTRLSREELDWITGGNLFEYTWKTEDSGEFDGKLAEGYIKRNLVRATEVQKKPNGYYVSVDLDVNCLSTK